MAPCTSFLIPRWLLITDKDMISLPTSVPMCSGGGNVYLCDMSSTTASVFCLVQYIR